MDRNNYVVIMAGGIGSRFWPFSRTSFPKQFHDVLGVGKTMIQQTAARFEDICPKENIYVVTNQAYSTLVKEQLPYLSDHQILNEPIGRNTAPCIAYACYKIAQRNKNANIVVAPADHVITQEKQFERDIELALDYTAQSDVLVTLGIKPSRPDTGYGYIQYLNDTKRQIKKVKTFTEKPALDLAIKFLESGDFLWNAGIFVWNASTIKKAFQTHLPDIAELFEEGKTLYGTAQEAEYIKRVYGHCRNISIDYGVMEKAENVYVVQSDFGWSDVGTWKSLYDLSAKTKEGNVLDGNIRVYDTHNCIVKTPKERLVVLEGLSDFIVAEFDNVLMICRKDHEQRVKDFVADLKNNREDKYI